MKSSIVNSTILAVAVLAMAAFAGVMIVGDDTDATAGDGLGQYTVTYSFDGSSIVKKMDTGNTFQFSASDIGGFTAPTGYEFKGTFIDVKSGTVYATSSPYTFTGDVVVEPELKVKADFAVVILTDGEVSKKFVLSLGSETSGALAAATPDLSEFLGTIGLKLVGDNIDIAKDGFIFDGFYKDKIASTSTKTSVVTGLSADEGAEVVYVAGFTPVYDISFVVEGATLPVVKSNDIDVVGGPEFNKIPGAPSKENYTFIGWYDAEGKQVIKYSVDAQKPYSYADETFKFTADTTLYAKFIPINMTVTFQVGEFTSTQTVLYGEKAMKPELPAGYIAWMFEDKEFDFDTPIVKNITIVALEGEPATIYSVVFEIEGQTPVKLDSENYKKSIPDTAREGYAFQGWVVKGASQYVDPMSYEITGDITFVAVYKEVAPPAPAEPKFYETPMGQCAIVLAVFVVGLFAFAVVTGRIELPKFKVSRVKPEAPEQVEEEKKP